MAVESPPAFEQGKTYSAEALRHVFGTLLQRGSAIGSIAGGLVGSADMQVTAGSGMQVLIAPGEAWVTGTSVSTQGGYYTRVTSSTALLLAASSESNPRIDTIIAQVKDKAYTGTEETFSVSVVTGTPEAGATLPNKKGAGAVPASSLVLAYVLVPAKASSITSVDIENTATPLTPGMTGASYREGTAAERPVPGVKGRVWYATDTHAYSVDTGSEWHELTGVPKYFKTETSLEGSIVKGSKQTGVTAPAGWFATFDMPRLEFSFGSGGEGGTIAKLLRNGVIVDEVNYRWTNAGAYSIPIRLAYLDEVGGSNEWSVELTTYGTSAAKSLSTGYLRIGP